ncbi:MULTISPECIES: DsbA family protein [unclassified Pseudomonas]|uniref:DsbA family protein n=1 Tax=unclassified Pseudomonas TaxID=196821 RepID=UPI0023629F43|nr:MULTISPECIES: thioredoxin domain-containing protein [unclassified Pseudomonas]
MSSRIPITLAGLAIVLSTASALYSAHALREQQQLVDHLNGQVARIQPYAFSRSDLDALLSRQSLSVAPPAAPEAPPAPMKRESAPIAGERRYGDATAQFSLIEYSDFECPYCKQYFAVPKAVVDSSRGNASVVFKHVPIHGEASRREAFAAECAGAQGGNDAFYRMAGAIFSSTAGNGTGTEKPLAVIASSIGLDGAALSRCIDNQEPLQKVKADFREAVELGIKETPTTIVRHNPSNKQVVLSGAKGPEDILRAMAKLVQGNGAAQ